VNVRDPHRLGFGVKGAQRLAGYIAKYCGKQMDSRALDQKRYFRSKGIVVPELKYWRLPDCTCMLDAVHSAFRMIEGHSLRGLKLGATTHSALCTWRQRPAFRILSKSRSD